MSKGKIAVLLSGQVRTWKQIINHSMEYYDTTKWDVDYFCHAWSYNTYKTTSGAVIEDVSEPEFQELKSILRPKKFQVTKVAHAKYDSFWQSALKSLMQASWYKREYERLHNFTYDIVVKSRYDIYFPNQTFQPRACEASCIFIPYGFRFTTENLLFNLDDVFFYGSSPAMDVLCEVARYNHRRLSIDRNTTEFNYYNRLGPGVRLWTWARERGLQVIPTHTEKYTIFRKEAVGMHPIRDAQEIRDFSFKTQLG